jgi:hypothetical protein
MRFEKFIELVNPVYKLHTTGKSFCIIAQNEIPEEYKETLKFSSIGYKFHWNIDIQCWLLSLNGQADLIYYKLKNIDENEDDNIISTEDDDYGIIDDDDNMVLSKSSIDKEREEFEKEKAKFEEEKSKYILLEEHNKQVKKYEGIIELQKNRISQLKSEVKMLEGTNDKLSDNEIRNINLKILQFIKFAYLGGIEKVNNPESNKAIHDIKLYYDGQKNLYCMKYLKRKNNIDVWDYDTDAMYLPQLRK